MLVLQPTSEYNYCCTDLSFCSRSFKNPIGLLSESIFLMTTFLFSSPQPPPVLSCAHLGNFHATNWDSFFSLTKLIPPPSFLSSVENMLVCFLIMILGVSLTSITRSRPTCPCTTKTLHGGIWTAQKLYVQNGPLGKFIFVLIVINLTKLELLFSFNTPCDFLVYSASSQIF